jgi:nucleotide-binding universal stress UspA family protein
MTSPGRQPSANCGYPRQAASRWPKRSTARTAFDRLGAPSAASPHEETLFNAAGVPFEREIGSGEPVPTLIETAERHGCDAIILGARGLGAI